MADPLTLYLLTSYLTFFAIAFLIFLIKMEKKFKYISLLEILSFLFILVGLIFGNLSAFGYALVCGGMIFFVADLYIRIRKEKKMKK